MKSAIFMLILLCFGGLCFPEEATTAEIEKASQREVPARYYLELAKVHQRYGMKKEAIQAYEKAIATETDAREKGRYYTSLAQLYLDMKKPAEAATVFEKAIEKAANRKEKMQLYMEIAKVYRRVGHFEKAEEALKQAVAQSENERERRRAKRLLFDFYRRQGSMDRVVAELEQKLKENPGDTETLEELAQVYYEVERKPQKAIPLLEKALELKPADSNLMQQLASLYQSQKEPRKAAALYEKLLKTGDQKRNKHYFEMLCYLYNEAGEEEKAQQYAERLLKENPDDPLIHIRLARLYERTNMPHKVISQYQQAIEKATQSQRKEVFQMQLANYYLRPGKSEEGIELLKLLAEKASSASIRKTAGRKLSTLQKKLSQPPIQE